MNIHDIDIDLPEHDCICETTNESGFIDVEPAYRKSTVLRLIEADRKKFGRNDNDNRQCRGEPVGYFYPWELERSLKAYPNGFPGAVAVYAAPQPADLCGASVSDKTTCGSASGDCDSQRAEPSSHSIQDCPEVDKWNCKYCKRVNSCPVQGHQDAQPVKPVKEIELLAEDLHINTYSPTPRPQWATHNDRGVRIVHLPTGTVAESHEERSPHRNREIALDRLRQAIAADPVKIDASASVLSDEEVLKIAIDSGLASLDSTGDVVCAWREDADISEYLVENARALFARYRNTQQEN